MLEILPHPKI